MTTKEKRKARYLANKDAEQLKMKEYQIANKERIVAKRKEYYNSLTDNFYTLYYLPEEHYVGVSNQPKLRMYHHKAKGRYIKDVEIVSTFETKRDALDAERYLHDILGYNGSGIKYNNNFATKNK